MEQHIQRGQQWLEQVLRLMGISAKVKIDEEAQVGILRRGESPDADACWLIVDETSITPAQENLLIGKGGETIDALQYLANTLLNIGCDIKEQQAFTVELNGYRVRRKAELMRKAEKVAKRVRETGEEVEIKYLSSAERRQVHTFLKDSRDLKTESRGQEPDRRLVVRLR